MSDNSTILLKGFGREADQVTLAAKRLENALKSTGAGLLYLIGKGLVNFTKASARSAKSVEEQEEALSKLTTLQKFAQKRIFQHTTANKALTAAYAWMNQNTDESNKHFMRMLMSLTSLVGTVWMVATGLGLLALAVGVLVIALQGQDNWLKSATEQYGLLHDVVLGLTEVFDPSKEDGLVNGMRAVAAVAAVMAAVFILTFSAPIALAVGGLMLAVYAFNIVKQKTDSLAAAVVAFGVVLGPFIGIMLYMSSGAMGIIVALAEMANAFFKVTRVVQLTASSTMAAFALIIGGIMALVYVAAGKGSWIKALVVGLVGAIMVGVGLFILGIAAIPAAIIATVLLAFAFIIRKRKELFALFKSILTFVLNLMIEIGKIVDKYNPIKKLGKLGGKLVGGLKGAFRADGGPVTGGRSYIVGEKGPELFTPSASGSITPNHHMGGEGGGGAQTINMTINVSGVTDRTDKRDLAREIGDMINQELRRQGGATTRGRF